MLEGEILTDLEHMLKGFSGRGQQKNVISIAKGSTEDSTNMTTKTRASEILKEAVKVDTEKAGRQDGPLSDSILNRKGSTLL